MDLLFLLSLPVVGTSYTSADKHLNLIDADKMDHDYDKITDDNDIDIEKQLYILWSFI